MSLSKNTTANRGAHHTPAAARTLALRLGALIDSAERDERGRIRFNPIHNAMEDGLGAPCRLDHYVLANRDTLFKKLSTYYSRSVDEMYLAVRGRLAGTWVIPQLAVLIVCYFWTEFQIHAVDVYHRYISRDVSLLVEVAENCAGRPLSTRNDENTRPTGKRPFEDVETPVQRKLPKQASGYIYCVTSEFVNHVKVGYWKADVINLHRRYNTYYHNPIFTMKKVDDCRSAEAVTLSHFHDHILSGELVEKTQWDNIIKFIADLK